MTLSADDPIAKQVRRALRSGDLARAEAIVSDAERQGAPSAFTRWALATVRRRTGHPDAALALLRDALSIDANFLRAAQDLGAALMGAGDAEAGLAAYRHAQSLAPTTPAIRSAVLMAMHYCASVSLPEIAEGHRAYGGLYPAVPRPPAWPRDPGGRLRVGFVSGDFRGHSTASFLPPLLEGRDPARWEVLLYSNVGLPDETTRRFQALADRWIDAAFLDDDALATRIRADRIDALIDLNGHTVGNRLGMFARRPAAFQATWLDYVFSTGLTQIDHFISDADHAPPAEDALHVGRPLRLATGTFCMAPPPDLPVAPRPPGPFTFGSFNALEKVGPGVLRTWAEILRAAPDTRLVISAAALDRTHGRERVIGTLDAAGIGRERVDLLGRADRAAFVRRYEAIDLHLDSFPYSGGLTTLEAMWMGVPTLTFAGDRIAGRHSASHLRRAGLGEFVVADREAYVAAAMRLAGAPERLHALRPALRFLVMRSSLVDGRAQAEAMHAALMRHA